MSEFKIKIKDTELLDIIKEDKKIATDYYQNNLKEDFDKWERLFEGKPNCYDNNLYKMPKSFYVSRDIMTTIRAVIPDLMRLLFTKEPINITGRNAEDIDKAKKLQALLNWQLTQLNPFFLICNTVFNDALLKGLSVIKISWIKEMEEQEYKEQLHEADIMYLEEQGVEIVSTEFIGDDELRGSLYEVTYKASTIKKNQPVISVLSSGEFLFDPTARNIEEAQFIIHRKIVTIDFLKRKENEGVYSNISDVIKSLSHNLEEADELRNVDETYYNDNPNEYNTARKNVVLNEYWGKIDINQDGLLEDVVISFVGDTILAIEENTYGEYPFFVFSPFPSAYKIHGAGVGELVENIQSTKTALFRELLLNVRRNNSRKVFFRENAFVHPSQVDDPNVKYVAIDRNLSMGDVMFPEPFEQLSPIINSTLQYLDRERQVNTGISELKQGIRTNDRQTATEASIKYEAANAQVQMIAVIFANAFKELFSFLVTQNQKFIDVPQTIRLLNTPIEITPDDLNGDFDLEISVSLGTGTAETRKRSLMSVYQLQMQLLQMGLTDQSKILHTITKLVEETGFKDVNNFVLTSEELTAKQQEQQMQMQQMQQMQMQQPNDMQGLSEMFAQQENGAMNE